MLLNSKFWVTQAYNAAIYGRSVMAAFVRVFAQKVTAHGVPQHGLVKDAHSRAPLNEIYLNNLNADAAE